jgi:hypothetical protein
VRVAVAALLVSASAGAWPVDVFFDLEVGRESFQRPSAISWIEIEDPRIATAEVLESGEILFTGVSAGRTLALLYAEGKMGVWRIRVAPRGEKVKPLDGAEALAAAKKACPGSKLEEKTLTSSVNTEKCRQAMLALFQTDAFSSHDLDLTFEVTVLQSQLQAMKLPRGVAAKYSGAGLILEGSPTPTEHRQALWELFRRSAGRVPLDDRTESQNNQQPTTNNP